MFLSPCTLRLLDLPKNQKGYRDGRDITATHLLHHNHLVIIMNVHVQSGCAHGFTLPRSASVLAASDAHRKSVIENRDRPRFRIGRLARIACDLSPLSRGFSVAAFGKRRSRFVGMYLAI